MRLRIGLRLKLLIHLFRRPPALRSIDLILRWTRISRDDDDAPPSAGGPRLPMMWGMPAGPSRSIRSLRPATSCCRGDAVQPGPLPTSASGDMVEAGQAPSCPCWARPTSNRAGLPICDALEAAFSKPRIEYLDGPAWPHASPGACTRFRFGGRGSARSSDT